MNRRRWKRSPSAVHQCSRHAHGCGYVPKKAKIVATAATAITTTESSTQAILERTPLHPTLPLQDEVMRIAFNNLLAMITTTTAAAIAPATTGTNAPTEAASFERAARLAALARLLRASVGSLSACVLRHRSRRPPPRPRSPLPPPPPPRPRLTISAMPITTAAHPLWPRVAPRMAAVRAVALPTTQLPSQRRVRGLPDTALCHTAPLGAGRLKKARST